MKNLTTSNTFTSILSKRVLTILFTIATLSLFSSGIASAAIKTWTGNASSDWTKPGNWSSGLPATSSDTVLIPGDSKNYPIISTSGAVMAVVINSVDEDATLTLNTGAYLSISNNITIKKKGALIQNAGVILTNGMDCYGAYFMVGGNLLSTNDVNIINDGRMIQTSGLIHIAATTGSTPTHSFGVIDGAEVTQTGGTINAKDFIIDGKFFQNEDSATSLFTIGRDFVNDGEFVSTAGTIQWTGNAASTTASDFKSGKNEFFNVIINGTGNPGFDRIPETKFQIEGNWTNNNPHTSVDNEFEMIFKAEWNSQTIGGTYPTTFYKVKLENKLETRPQFVLGNDIAIADKLELKEGIISIGEHDITMHDSAELTGASKEAYVYTNGDGVFTWKGCAADEKRLFPVGCELHEKGYASVEIEFNTGHVTDDYSVGTANVVTMDGTRTGTPDTSSVVKITWYISEGTPGGSNLDFKFEWNDTLESEKFDKDDPVYLRHHTGIYWEKPIDENGLIEGSGPFKCTIEGYTGGFSPFGVGSENADVQTCYAIADLTNELTMFTLPGMVQLGTITLGPENFEASTLNLAGDTLFALNQDSLYFIAVTDLSPTAVSVSGDDIDYSGMSGAYGSINRSDYDAMSVDENGNIWAISALSNAVMVVINQTTGHIIEDYFGTNVDYMPVKLRAGHSVDAMAFDPLNNDLYINMNTGSGAQGTDHLFRVNSTTGDTTFVSTFAVGDVEGMGFDALGRLLVTTGASSTPIAQANQLWVVDVNSGSITSLGATPGTDTETCDCKIGEATSLVEISGYVFNDLGNDTMFNHSDTAMPSIGVKLFHDVDSNGVYSLGVDTLLESILTNSNGFYYFRKTFTNNNDDYIVIVDETTLPTNFVLSTDSMEVATFSHGDSTDSNNNFGIYDPAALPVEMLSFTAKAVDKNVVLDWSTASELNNQGFEVQRSIDGENFITLDFVYGTGTTQEIQNYQYTDYNPNMGVNYYRLKQIDFDGEFEYSYIRMVEFKESLSLNQISLYPNPSNTTLNIRLNEHRDPTQMIQVLDITGTVVIQITDSRILSLPVLTVDVSTLPSGMYLLTSPDSVGNTAQRFIVQH